MNKEFSVGSDPETALVDKKGVFISAVNIINGTKTEPLKTKHGFVQHDGALAEFNSNPSHNEDEFYLSVKNVLDDLSAIIKPLDLSVHIAATVLYPEKELNNPEAREAGCSPDYDAWNMCVNEPPDLSATNMRSLGGHLHIAWQHLDKKMSNRPDFVRVMDLTAGIPSVIMDTDIKRRGLYGKAGAHRPKMLSRGDPYNGIEYRSLSNFWLQSEEHIRWAYQSVKSAIDRFEEFTKLISDGVINQDIVTGIINSSDREEALNFVDKYGINYV